MKAKVPMLHRLEGQSFWNAQVRASLLLPCRLFALLPSCVKAVACNQIRCLVSEEGACCPFVMSYSSWPWCGVAISDSPYRSSTPVWSNFSGINGV